MALANFSLSLLFFFIHTTSSKVHFNVFSLFSFPSLFFPKQSPVVTLPFFFFFKNYYFFPKISIFVACEGKMSPWRIDHQGHLVTSSSASSKSQNSDSMTYIWINNNHHHEKETDATDLITIFMADMLAQTES